MKRISLKTVEIFDFRSYKGRHSIDLRGDAGLHLITGNNLAEPRLGANGIGKSTIFDALCFCLYGVSVSGLRASDLICEGADRTTVAISLGIDDGMCAIQRDAPPNRVYIDGVQVEQADVDRLVGLSKQNFLSSVIYGQGSPLFLDLSAPARGDLLDDVLNSERWMKAAKLAGTECDAVSKELGTLRVNAARLEGELSGLPDIEELKAAERRWNKEQKEVIATSEKQIAGLTVEIESLRSTVEASTFNSIVVEKARSSYKAAQNAVTALKKDRVLLVKDIEDHTNSLDFYTSNNSCPTCGQTIRDAPHRILDLEEHLAAKQEALSALDAQLLKALAVEANASSRVDRAIAKDAEARKERQLQAERIADKERECQRLLARQSQLKDQKCPYTESRIQASRKRRELQQRLEVMAVQRQMLLDKQAELEYWRNGFKKLRLYCLEKVLAELTVESKSSFHALGLQNWRIKFATATENKSGGVKFGVQAEISATTSNRRLDMMSGGEAQRARLAVSLGLAKLIQRRAGVQWDFEVFDEPSSWLSEPGVEDLLEALSIRAQRQQKLIWMCDHRSFHSGAFCEVATVTKDKDGSHFTRSNVA